MYMKLGLLLALMISNGSADDGDVVMSFATMDHRPFSILMPHICWDHYKLQTLSKRFCDEGVSHAFSLQPNRTEFYLNHVIVLADLSCPGTDDFLEKASNNKLFKAPYRWLIISEDKNDLSVLNRLSILLDSDVVIAQKGREGMVMFLEAYKIIDSSEVILTPRASWQSIIQNSSLESSLKPFRTKYGLLQDYRKSPVLATRRTNLMKNNLTVVLVITDSNDTQKHLDDRLNLQQDSISKMTYVMASACFEMLNATTIPKFTNSWGYMNKRGEWEGVTDFLVKKTADLGTMSLFTESRHKVQDYIAHAGTTAFRFILREPPLAYMENIFALPFSWTVWLACVVCILACALGILITTRWEASQSAGPMQLDGSWADVLILVIGAVLQQGCTHEPRYVAGRLVMYLLYISMTILYAAYSANIVVLLRAPSSSVRTLADMAHSPLSMGAVDLVYNRYYLPNMKEPLRKYIYDTKIAPKGKKPNFMSMEEGIDRVRQGLFALHLEVNPGYRLIQETFQENEKCDLVEIDYLNEIDPWVPGQKRAAHKELFKINFMKLREVGIQSCQQLRLQIPKPRCSGQVSTFSSVGITDIYPAMVASLYGVLMALAVLVLEIAYHKLRKLREMKMSLTSKLLKQRN